MDPPATNYQPFKPAPWSMPHARRRYKQRQIALSTLVCASLILSLAGWITATFALKISTFMLVATLGALLLVGLLLWAFSLMTLSHKALDPAEEGEKTGLSAQVQPTVPTPDNLPLQAASGDTILPEADRLAMLQGLQQLEQGLQQLQKAPWLQTRSQTAIRLKTALGWWYEDVMGLFERLAGTPISGQPSEQSQAELPQTRPVQPLPPQLGYVLKEAQAQFALLMQLAQASDLSEETLADAERQIIDILNLFQQSLQTSAL